MESVRDPTVMPPRRPPGMGSTVPIPVPLPDLKSLEAFPNPQPGGIKEILPMLFKQRLINFLLKTGLVHHGFSTISLQEMNLAYL